MAFTERTDSYRYFQIHFYYFVLILAFLNYWIDFYALLKFEGRVMVNVVPLLISLATWICPRCF